MIHNIHHQHSSRSNSGKSGPHGGVVFVVDLEYVCGCCWHAQVQERTTINTDTVCCSYCCAGHVVYDVLPMHVGCGIRIIDTTLWCPLGAAGAPSEEAGATY